MNLQLTHTTTAPAPSPFKKRYLAAAGAALIVAMVVGVGAWQTADHSKTARTASAPASVASHVAPVTANAPLPYTYYLVSSQEQADSVQASWDDAVDEGYIQSEPLFHVQIIGSPEEEQQSWADVIDLDADGAAYHAPAIRVVDLRPSASSPAAP
jgi:hypothetical protein